MPRNSGGTSSEPAALLRIRRAYMVDAVINWLGDQLIIIRFGNEGDPKCKQTDEWLKKETKGLQWNGALICTVDMDVVPELVARFKLSAPATIIFFSNRTVADHLSGEALNPDKFKQTLNTLLGANQPKPNS